MVTKMGGHEEVVIESKRFILSKVGGGLLRLTERKWKTEHAVLLGPSSLQWLGMVLEESL